MPNTQFNPGQLRAMFTGQSLSATYTDAVSYYWKLKVHADGDVPVWLIKKARPNESDAVAAYRADIYEPETQNPIERVLGVFEKIHRSPDFMIRFSDEVPAIIAEDETPEKYLAENYPVYGSIEYWLFEEALRYSALDANAVVAVMPASLKEAQDAVNNNEYIQPVARVFSSCEVIKFVAEDYAVLKSNEFSFLLSPAQQQTKVNAAKSAYYENNQIQVPPFSQGQVYYVINTIYYQKWEENGEGKFQLTEQFVHNLGELPAFQMPGKYVKRVGDSVLKKSLLNPMVPHLNNAARESNDLRIGIVKHLHLKEWVVSNNDCKDCNGTGIVPSTSGPIPCGKCKGSGTPTGTSPTERLTFKVSAFNNMPNMPFPWAGYIDLDPTILKIAKEFIESDIYKSLSSVNMERLSDSPLNQSGIAKEWDHNAENHLVYSEAENLIYILNMAIYFTVELRYKDVVTDKKQRKAMLPFVPVPDTFDLVGYSDMVAEFDSSKKAGVSDIILRALQLQITKKKFYDDEKLADFIETVMNLDPFPNATIEEKSMMESSGLAAKEDIILSNYISDFVKQAMEKDKAFMTKTLEEKRTVLLQMATDKVAQLSTAKQVITDILGNNNLPNNLPNNGQQTGVPPNNLPVGAPAAGPVTAIL